MSPASPHEFPVLPVPAILMLVYELDLQQMLAEGRRA